MYEVTTFEKILKRMMDRIPLNIDKREGSVIYDALAPAAAELHLMYIEADVILNETFADTAHREYLIKRALERGLKPYPASKAILKGEFNCEIPIGSRFSLKTLNYVVIEKLSDFVYKLECESSGREGNRVFGTLIPIEYIDGLTKAELTELLIPGEDEEDTEDFRQRYLNSLNAQAYGGNIADYKEKTKSISGVGGVKVYPVWKGGGTVRVSITDSEYNEPTETLIDKVQTILDPIPNNGLGLGIAPIGHVVTVTKAETESINITFHITYKDGYLWEDIRSYVENEVDSYLLDLRKKWEDNDNICIKVILLEAAIIQIEGVEDVQDTEINGVNGNYILEKDKIPIRGKISG